VVELIKIKSGGEECHLHAHPSHYFFHGGICKTSPLGELSRQCRLLKLTRINTVSDDNGRNDAEKIRDNVSKDRGYAKEEYNN
jgi:hypothetical protein